METIPNVRPSTLPTQGLIPSMVYSMLVGPRLLLARRCSAKGGGAFLRIRDHQWLLRRRRLLVQRQVGHAARRGLGGVLTLSLIAAFANTRASEERGSSRCPLRGQSGIDNGEKSD